MPLSLCSTYYCFEEQWPKMGRLTSKNMDENGPQRAEKDYCFDKLNIFWMLSVCTLQVKYKENILLFSYSLHPKTI